MREGAGAGTPPTGAAEPEGIPGAIPGAFPGGGNSLPEAALRGSRFLPPALVLAGVVTAVWLSSERGGLHRSRRDVQTFQTLARASNLSAEHGFAGFLYRFVDGDGEVRYEPYNRFPPGGLFLIRAVIAPFAGDLSAQVRAARFLMFACFAGIAVLAYLSLLRLTGRGWLAAAATLLALSSYWWGGIEVVSTEIAPDLFAFLLTFHGMVVFVQEGRFRPLLVRTGAALLVGWHVYALLAPFLVLGWALVWAREGRRLRAEPEVPERNGRSFPAGRLARGTLRRVGAVLRSRYTLLGGVAFLFGLGIVGWNFHAEHRAFGGESALRDLPSVRSLLYRTGQNETFNERYADALDWQPYLTRQLERLGWMAAPVAWPGNLRPLHDREGTATPERATGFGALALGVALPGLLVLRNRGLFAVLAVSGFFWTLPMRHTVAFHDFESLYHLGLTLVFWTVVLTVLSRWLGRGFLPGAAGFAALVFGFSWNAIAAEGRDPERAAFWRRVEADFDAIRTLTAGGTVFWPEWRWRDPPFLGMHLFPFYLSGRVLVIRQDVRRAGDFSLRRRRHAGPALLTPDNREVFLYHREALEGDLFRSLEESAVPGIRERFEVYVRNGWVLYRRDGCSEEDRAEPFFLRLFPDGVSGERPGEESNRSAAERGRGPAGRDSAGSGFGSGYLESEYFRSRGIESRVDPRDGSADLVFDFDRQSFSRGERCVAGVRLPESGVGRLETGQFAPTGDGRTRILWEGAIPVADPGAGGTGAR